MRLIRLALAGLGLLARGAPGAEAQEIRLELSHFLAMQVVLLGMLTLWPQLALVLPSRMR